MHVNEHDWVDYFHRVKYYYCIGLVSVCIYCKLVKNGEQY